MCCSLFPAMQAPCWCTHTTDVSIISGQRLHDPVPDAGPPPANEPIVASGTGSVGLRQIAPRCARPQDPEGTIEETPVIYARDVAWFVREHRFDDAPFAVAQFTAHESRLHFGSLNHAWDGEINGPGGQVRCWRASRPVANVAKRRD